MLLDCLVDVAAMVERAGILTAWDLSGAWHLDEDWRPWARVWSQAWGSLLAPYPREGCTYMQHFGGHNHPGTMAIVGVPDALHTGNPALEQNYPPRSALRPCHCGVPPCIAPHAAAPRRVQSEQRNGPLLVIHESTLNQAYPYPPPHP